MGPSRYRDVDESLPWMGGAAWGPRRPTVDDALAVGRAEDPVALGLMLGYARSYAGVLGGVVIGATAATACALAGQGTRAVAATVVAGLSALSVVETRRRARAWAAIIEARLAVMGERA